MICVAIQQEMKPFTDAVKIIAKTNEDNLEIPLSDFCTNNIRNELSQITVLNFTNCNLTELPSLHNLNLKELILARNQLKEIPSCLYSSLDRLEYLDLSHNFIQNFDIEPACSCNIVTLKINDNRIYNLPHWILTLRCPKLVELFYSRNFLVQMKALHEINVKKLEMRSCQLIDYDFRFFKNIKSLEVLDLSNDLSSGRKYENWFKNIGDLFNNPKWVNLQVLILNNILISIVPSELFYVYTITELHLMNCDLSWIPEEVQYLIKLRHLDVSNNIICSLTEHLCKLEDLIIVKASYNRISFVSEFVNDLEILDLYHNLLEDFPSGFERINLIDLELNPLDTKSLPSYEIYKNKCDKLRQLYNYERIEGFIIPSDLDYFEECEKASITSEPSGHYEIGNVEVECWDEEEEDSEATEKNPEVTSSDDEWDCRDCIRDKVQQQIIHFDANEDWIFCDAD